MPLGRSVGKNIRTLRRENAQRRAPGGSKMRSKAQMLAIAIQASKRAKKGSKRK